MNRGYVKIYRKIDDNFLWQTDEPYCKRMAWIDLILLANHEENIFMRNGQRFRTKRGQHLCSREHLAKRWKWSVNKVDNFLKILQEEGMIYKEAVNKGTVITIVNYGVYQGNLEKKEQQKVQQKVEQKSFKGVSDSTAEGTQTIMNKNDINNDKKMNKKKDFFDFEDY